MKQIKFGDILAVDQLPGHHILVHGCNAQGVMASGIAASIRAKWPGAYDAYMEAYRRFPGQQTELMGSISAYQVPDSNLIVANAITQLNYGRENSKYVSYEAISKAFNELAKTVHSIADVDSEVTPEIHYPLIGAGLGGGDWAIISDIIESTFAKYSGLTHTLWIKE